MRNHMGWTNNLLKVVLVGAAGLLLGGIPAKAQPTLSGVYHCVSVEVAGTTRPCTAPSLEMNSDGSYQMLAAHGKYSILGGRWLILSAANKHRRARLDGSREIIFEFISNGKKNVITYRRKYQRPPAWVSG